MIDLPSDCNLTVNVVKTGCTLTINNEGTDNTISGAFIDVSGNTLAQVSAGTYTAISSKWCKPCTITYKGGDGIDITTTQTFSYDDSLEFPVWTVEGYSISSWTDSDGNTVSEKTIPTGDATYTAIWTADEATITFVDPNGTEEDVVKTATTDAEIDFTFPEWTLAGYILFWTDSEGTAITELPDTYPAENTVYTAV